MSELSAEEILPLPMLERFRERAAGYDRENRFFTDDLSDLRECGYLDAVVPREIGGAGISLETLVDCQRLLAAHAPATALGVNMHLVWVHVARFLHERGIDALDGVLRDAVAGEVFAFGISEAGNEAVLLDAISTAEPDGNGGYRISGTKVFTTLSPVWTRLGVHARCEQPGVDPYLVFGFVRRESPEIGGAVRRPEQASLGLVEGTIEHPGAWNPLGMRATQSWNTRLEGVQILPDDVAAKIAPFDGSEPLVLAIFASFSLLTASVYAGIGDRALELARQAANQTGSGGEGVRLDDPELASRLTDAVLDHRRSLDALTLLARDVDDIRPREDWFLALAAARNQVSDEARRTVEVAMRYAGTRGYQADSELARLYRDVLAGMFHPSSASALAKTVRGSLVD